MAKTRTIKEAAPKSLRLVGSTVEALRDLILQQETGALIGSLPDLAARLGVGTVTVQQAARVLEHEGLLKVRRGPSGGYYGCRPDASTLERSLAIYLRVRGADDYEALEMMTLLDCELMPAAASCKDPSLFDMLQALKLRVDQCTAGLERAAFEDAFYDYLFKMVNRPLIELLHEVAMRFYRRRPIPIVFDGEEGLRAWRQYRHHILDALLAQDPERARFEAERHRKKLLANLDRERDNDADPEEDRAQYA